MSFKLSLKPTATHFGKVYFSRGPSLQIQRFESIPQSQRPQTTKQLQSAMSKSETDTLVVLPSHAIPHDIEANFREAESAANQLLGPLGNPFWQDLQTLCKYVGFATYIGIDTENGGKKSVTGLAPQDIPLEASLLVKGDLIETASPTLVFGNFYNQIVDRFFIVATQENDQSYSNCGNFFRPIFISALIAHELGHLKLIAKCKQANIPVGTLSNAANEFYSYAYAYTFISSLASFGIINQRAYDPDFGIIAVTLREKFCFCFEEMSQAERGQFLLGYRTNSPMHISNIIYIDLNNR